MSGIQQSGMIQEGRSLAPGDGGGGDSLVGSDADWPDLESRDGFRPELPGLLLKDTIERAIVPHLLTLHSSRIPASAQPRTETETLAVAFARQAAGGHPEQMAAHLESLLEAGAKPNQLCLDILAPAARHLGDLWVEDEFDFVAVTIGVIQLQKAMSRLMPRGPLLTRAPGRATGRAGSILMVPVPGNQHTFGLTMAADFFHRAGWIVSGGTPRQLDALQHHLRTHVLDAIGFSVSCESQLEMLSRSLSAVRQCSCNPRIVTVIGGPLFIEDPALARQFGADMVATDGAKAPHQLALLLPDLKVRLQSVVSLPRERRA